MTNTQTQLNITKIKYKLYLNRANIRKILMHHFEFEEKKNQNFILRNKNGCCSVNSVKRHSGIQKLHNRLERVVFIWVGGKFCHKE